MLSMSISFLLILLSFQTITKSNLPALASCKRSFSPCRPEIFLPLIPLSSQTLKTSCHSFSQYSMFLLLCSSMLYPSSACSTVDILQQIATLLLMSISSQYLYFLVLLLLIHIESTFRFMLNIVQFQLFQCYFHDFKLFLTIDYLFHFDWCKKSILSIFFLITSSILLYFSTSICSYAKNNLFSTSEFCFIILLFLTFYQILQLSLANNHY